MKKLSITIALIGLVLTSALSAQHISIVSDVGNVLSATRATGAAITGSTHYADLSDATEIVVSAHAWAVGGNGVTITIEYSTDGGQTWQSTGGSVTISSTDPTIGTATTLPAAATTGIWLRAVTNVGGSGDEVYLYYVDAVAT